MKKRFILFVLLVFLSACEFASEEVLIPSGVIEDTEIVEDENQPLTDNMPLRANIAFMSSVMPPGAITKVTSAINKPLDWYSSPNLDVIFEYSLVYLFYDEQFAIQLQEAGFSWPELRPYETVRYRLRDTDIVFINFSDSIYRNEALDELIGVNFQIEDNIVKLFEPLVFAHNSNLVSPEICRVPHDERLRNDYWEMVMGFPRPTRRLPHDQSAKALVLFVDFKDYPASRSIEALNDLFVDRYVSIVNNYLQAVSYGKVQHDFYFHHDVISMDLPVEQYYLSQEVRQANRNIVDPFVDYTELFVREVLKVADATVDFSPYDYVIIHTDPNLPLEYARLAWAGSAREGKGYVTSDKTFYNMNAWSAEMLRPNHEYVGVHEILHLYGLPDYYSNIEGVWRGDEFLGSFDLMSNAMGKNKELLLWSRWFIGWVTNDDVECLDARRPFDSSQHVLNATFGDEGVKGVMIRLSEFELLLIERKDYNPYCLSCKGGLLVTIQDTSKPSMWGSLQIVRPDFSSDVNFEDAFLTLGSVLETNRLRIEVIEDNNAQTMIQITQLGN